MTANGLSKNFLPVIALSLMVATVPLAVYSVARTLLTNLLPMVYNISKVESQIGSMGANCYIDSNLGVVWTTTPTPSLIKL